LHRRSSQTLIHGLDLLNPNLDVLDDSNGTSSLDALTSRRSRQAEKNVQVLHSAVESVSSENASTSVSGQSGTPLDTASPATAELEEEAEGEGAFNPETGEINWDCPCLGGMAHGPCGPEFREAFSCFVFSKEEPKGMDCIEKFQGMRDCFQQHPDVYKDELMEDEEIDREVEAERQELAQQIAERQKADGESGRRLLEEPAPEPRPAKSTKTSKKSPAESASKSSSSDEVTSDPKRSTIEGKDSTNPPIPVPALGSEITSSADDGLPRAARDATDAVVPSDKETKN
jgi:mitochondrial intermembrane space import and assembly protein 40